MVPEGESLWWIQFVFLVFEVIYMERADGEKGKVVRSLLKVFHNHLKLVFLVNSHVDLQHLEETKDPEPEKMSAGKVEMGRNKKAGYNWTG